MNQQAMRQAARRSALDAQAVRRKERADRERRLEGLAVAVLTALGERDAAVRGADRRAGEALQTMTDDEGLSLREAVEWDTSASRRLRGGRAGHVNEERIAAAEWTARCRSSSTATPASTSAATTAKSSTSAPRTRLPSPSRAPSKGSSTTFAPGHLTTSRSTKPPPQARGAPHRVMTASNVRDLVRRPPSSRLGEAKCLCAAKPGRAATRRAQETAACVVEGSTMVVYVDR